MHLVHIQLGAPIRIIKEDHCELIHEATGRLTCDMVDRRVEREYNFTLDRLADWRRGKPAEASLEGSICHPNNKKYNFCFSKITPVT